MKSCIEWRKSFKFLSEIDEFNIIFRNKKDKLLHFLDTYAISQRVNIIIPTDISDNEIDILIAIANMKKYNIAIRFSWIDIEDNQDAYIKIKNAKIPFYFSYSIQTWEELNQYVSYGVSDVFITGELGFDLIRVKEFCTNKNVQIRCYANICQSEWDDSEGVKTFFIRPEDIGVYDMYIDIIEFYQSENKQNPLYEIYFKDLEWNGDLREIIQGLKKRVNNYYLIGDTFAFNRIACHKDCIKTSHCNLCEKIFELADTIENSKEFEIYERVKRNNG